MVKCRECGFLAVRDELGEVCEATRETREKGTRRDYTGHWGCPSLFCYCGSAAFPSVPRNPIQAIAAAITAAIDCPRWQPWREGKSPKEHEEMGLIEISELRQAQLRHEDREESSRRDHTTRWLAIGAMIVSVAAAVIGQAVGYYLNHK